MTLTELINILQEIDDDMTEDIPVVDKDGNPIIEVYHDCYAVVRIEFEEKLK